MNKNLIRGWRDVLTFTYVQTMKSKGIRITTLILFLIAVAVSPVMALFSGNKSDESKSSEDAKVKTLYVVDDTKTLMKGISEILATDQAFQGTKFVEKTDLNETETKIEQLTGKDDNEMLMHIQMTDGAYHVTYQYGENSNIGIMTAETFSEQIDEKMQDVIMNAYGVTKESMELIKKPVDYEVQELKDNQSSSEADQSNHHAALSSGQYSFISSIAVIMTMILAFAGEAIASSIVTEKSSKVIEILLTSIKPMAIICGKVLAMLGVILTQGLVLTVGFIGSSYVTNKLNGSAGNTILPDKMVQTFSGMDLELNLIWAKVIFVIIGLAFGILTFGLIAGLAGSSISKMDELAEGMKLYSFVLVVCVYIVIAVITMDNVGGANGILIKALALIPLTSPFLTPGYLLIGKISIWIALASVIIQFIFLILLWKFVAGIYEYLIYYNGEPLKMKDFIRLAKKERKGKNKNE